MALRRTLLRLAAPDLFTVMRGKVEVEKAKVKDLMSKHGETVLSTSSVEQCYQGTRGVTTMVYEPSLLDAEEGIRFRGLSIPECQQKLPKFPGCSEMQPEGMLWLLLTGEVPSEEQVRALTGDLAARATSAAGDRAIKQTFAVVDSFPQGLHPMKQLVAATAAMGHDSTFYNRYQEGMKKTQYWEAALEDSLDLIARLPAIAAKIFQRTYGKNQVPGYDRNLDWTGNFVKQLGLDPNGTVCDCLRLYLSIHVDHEGGNVSAHTVQLVGSTLSDPYLSYSAGMAGLAGPLHGLANQEVLLWLLELYERLEQEKLLDAPREQRKEAIVRFSWDVLNKGQVIPGYGHAVLRRTDPRYMCEREFALKHMKDFKLFQLLDLVYETMTDILTKHGKTKNPYPNVDAHSGVLLQFYGLTQQDFYTVFFGVSRALGVLAALVWNRALGAPIERPKSVTTESLLKQFKMK